MKNISQSIIELDCLSIINNVSLKKFNNSKVLILGANGFLAKYIQSTLSFANLNYNLKCKVYSLSRNTPKIFTKFFKR